MTFAPLPAPIPAWPFPLLSVDPSSTVIGWALLGPGPTYLCSGDLRIPATRPDERILMVPALMGWQLSQLPWRPAAALVEVPDYIGERADKSKLICYIRAVGAVEATLALRDLPVIAIHASHLKDRFRKQRFKDLFRLITGRPPSSDDESDAVAQGWEYVEHLNKAGTQPSIPL